MTLYIVATPLGNLKDMSQRALEVLSKVDLILAEDTRRTGKLLAHFKISKKLESFHQYSAFSKIDKILEWLEQGREIALVSDAGTPAISDPGVDLLSRAWQEIWQEIAGVKIVPIPGPSAVTAALSVSGFKADSFCFRGYPPKKASRRAKFFQEIVKHPETQVFFSTPHSIVKDLVELQNAGLASRLIFVAREMSKIFETFYRGSIGEVLEKIKNQPQKGEYTLVISQISTINNQ